jgi:hypothetical protein
MYAILATRVGAVLLALLLGLASIPVTAAWLQTVFIDDTLGQWPTPPFELMLRSAGLPIIAAVLAGSLVAKRLTGHVLGRAVVAVAVAWTVACMTLTIVPETEGVTLDWGGYCITGCSGPDGVLVDVATFPAYFLIGLGVSSVLGGGVGSWALLFAALVFARKVRRDGESSAAWAVAAWLAVAAGLVSLSWLTIWGGFPAFAMLVVGASAWAWIVGRAEITVATKSGAPAVPKRAAGIT